MAPPAERRGEKARGRAEAGCRQGWGEVRIIDAWGRAGSTGAFWNGLQAEGVIALVKPVAVIN